MRGNDDTGEVALSVPWGTAPGPEMEQPPPEVAQDNLGTRIREDTMVTLTITETHDFTGETHFFISRIEFDTVGRNLATFSSAQFGGSGISNNVVIADTGGPFDDLNDIRVEMSASGSFSAAGWTMVNWNSDDDFIFLVGSGGGDSITGTNVNDRLLGGGGGDQLNGGAGIDLASYAEATAGVTAWMLNPAFNLGEANGDTYISIEDLEGSDFNDVLGANNADNFVRGRHGDDTLKGMGGADTLFGDEDNDTLFGGADGDRLVGFTGDDTLIGGANADELEGGTGTDTASYRDAAEGFNGAGVAVVMLDTALNSGDADGDTYKSIENLEGSEFNDFLAGDNARNEIFGRDGNDVLTGEGADDTLRGGDNNDTLFGDTGLDTLHGDDDDDILDGGTNNDTLNGGEGDDTLRGGTGLDILNGGDGVDEADYSDRTAAVSVTLAGANLANVSIGGVNEDTVRSVEDVTGGSAGDTLRGDGVANTLSGLGGTDTLRGGGGADTLIGGNDADTFEYVAASDAVAGESVSGGSGSDTLRFLHSGVLNLQPVTLASIENLQFQSGAASSVTFTASQFGAGVSNAVQITGNGQLNTVSVNTTSTGTFSAANWTFVSWDPSLDRLNFTGTAGNDTITGSVIRDHINGGRGSDTLNGGGGADTVSYENNVDRVIVLLGVNGAAGNAYEFLAPGQGPDSVDTLTSIENVLGTNFGDTLVGNEANNVFHGRDGDDNYFVQNAGDVVRENGGEGSDEVFASVSYTLTAGSDVEILRTTDDEGTAQINLTGNGANNHIIGNDGLNLLEGGGGNSDTLEGRDGSDTYIVRNANVEIDENGGEGNDHVAATVDYALTEGADVEFLSTLDDLGTDDIDLTGNNSGNVVVGNNGNNVLNGGGGRDTLIGLGDADRFLFDSALAATNVDEIRDFEDGSDLIVLDDDIFNTLTPPKGLEGALAADEFVIAAAAQDAEDRIIYNSATGALLFDRDGVGGAAAIQFATLSPGLNNLSADDFLVIL